MADRYEQAVREIFDNHVTVRDYNVAHLPNSKLYTVNPEDEVIDDEMFWIGRIAGSDSKDDLVQVGWFVDELNMLQPDQYLHLETKLVVDALTKLWDFRCTVRAN